jgi:hypothetical protein
LPSVPLFPLPLFRFLDRSAVTLAMIFEVSTLWRAGVCVRFASFDSGSAELYPGLPSLTAEVQVSPLRFRHFSACSAIRRSGLGILGA